MQHATTQTLRAVSSVICRVVLLGIALPVLLADFPDYVLPSRLTQDWSMLVTCDARALLAPLLRWRKLAFLAGVLALVAGLATIAPTARALRVDPAVALRHE